MADAAPSNAGDRYHFVYVARRMLDMLPPNSQLSLIQMENVSVADQAFASHPDDLLGVDLAEYYGGSTFDTASHIVLTQVKYSALHPNETWTQAKLSRDKQSSTGGTLSGTSVLRKLSNMFNVVYQVLEEESRNKVSIKLVTNQRLDDVLQTQLTSIQAHLTNISACNDSQSGQLLNQLANNGNDLLDWLKTTTNLSWKRLSTFLRCWDLTALGQAMSTRQETEFAQLLDQYVDMGIHFGNLISFVQEHAVPHRRADITREQVFGILRIRESSFFPAPARFANTEQLQVTENFRKICESLSNPSHNVILIHGVSGTGKSSTLQLLQQNINNEIIVIYDCFGNGQGVGLDTRRFPFKNFYVQLINELALRFDTHLYVTTQIDADEIRQRFNVAIVEAVKAAATQGKRLIIAVDAIDDAAEAALEHPNRQDESFVPTLWRVRWPENCTLLVTSRTENRHLLTITCDYTPIEITGFSPEESDLFLQRNEQLAEEDLLKFTYDRTHGNPRVLSKILDAIEHEQPSDLRAFIDTQAETTTFAYYRKQVPKALRENSNDWLLLATLREATQFITVEDLSKMTLQSKQDINSLVERLYFGLRVSDDGEIRWHDKDFVSYIRQFSDEYADEAQRLLAEYCLKNYDSSAYAERHLSRHLFRAGRYAELTTWWMSDHRLIKKLSKSLPHTEDAADDIQYTLLAAIELQDFESALKVVGLAAEIAQGLDVFSSVVAKYPRIVAERGYTGRLLGHVRRREEDSELMPILFSLARSLVEYSDQQELAQQLFDEGSDVVERIKRQRREEAIWQDDTVVDIAVYDAYTDGLSLGLDSLAHWKPQEHVARLYAELTYIWCQQHSPEDAIETINQHSLNVQQKAYAVLGVLRSPNLSIETARLLAEQVLVAIKDGVIDNFSVQSSYPRRTPDYLSEVLDSLIRHGIDHVALELLHKQGMNVPNSRHNVDIAYVQYVAYRKHLHVEDFDPDSFKIPDNKEVATDSESLPDNNPRAKREREEQERKKQESETEIRKILKLLFPPCVIKLKALSGETPDSVLREIDVYIENWWNQTRPYWYDHEFFSHVQSSCFSLLEAVCLLPGYHIGTVRKIIQMSERLLGSTAHHGLTQYANLLALHEPYQREAENLICRRLDTIKAPDYNASDAVDAMLELYLAAVAFDQNLARDIFTRARIEAGGWDSRINGAAYALLATLAHAQPTHPLEVAQLDQLATIFHVIKKVTEGYDTEIHLDWFIRLLTNINPAYGFSAVFEFDRSEFISLADSVAGIAQGLMDQYVPAETVYPLVNILDSIHHSTVIYEQATLLASAESKANVIHNFAKYIQIEAPRERRNYYAKQVVDWAHRHGLSQDPNVVALASLAIQLDEFEARKTQSEKDYEDYYDAGDALLAEFKIQVSNSPLLGLQLLLDAADDDLRKMRFVHMQEVIQTLVDQLPTSKTNDILLIIERFHEKRYEPEAFSLIAIVAERNTLPNTVHDACIACLTRLLTPAYLDLITRWRYREQLDALLSYGLSKDNLLTTFLHATSNALPQLYTNELYRLVGALSSMVSPEQSFNIYQLLQSRAAAKLPTDFSISIKPYSQNDLYTLYLKLLTNCLGHPDQRLCWRVLYALTDICINRPEPSLRILVSELDDKHHERWMTKRVWLLVLFHHLALRQPIQIAPFISKFVEIALDKEFPHAKMRYHAKHSVIALAAKIPGIIDKKILELIEQVNCPQSTTDKENRLKTDVNESDEAGWQFDWDTSNYWFRQIEECFRGDRPSVGSVARRWIVEKIDISADKAHWQTDWVQKKYKYDNTSNRQGGLPRVESLRMYAELHARYLAAGELIDSYPAYIDKWSNETLWKHYERYSIRGLDPLFPIRLRQMLPTTARNHGVFDKPYEEWAKKDDENEYLSELWSSDQKDEVVVAASFGASSDERDWSVRIESYFVDTETSASLAQLINSQLDALQLPHSHYAVYDYSIGDLPDLLSQWRDTEFFEGEIEENNFKLYGWTYYWSQELPQHDIDERQERYGIGLEVLAPSFVTQNHIQFNPFTLEWYRDNDISIGRSEFWADREGRGKHERFTSGHKLIIAYDFLKEYLHDNKLDLLLIVRFSRSRPYGEQYKEERTYDPGTVRAFIFNAKEEVTLHMEQALIEKGQKLIKEFSDEHATTLQRWMAQHIAGLMKALDTVENDRDRQALSTQCASLISRLWEIRVEQQTINLQRDLWNVIRLPDEELDLATLSNALQNPPSKEDLKPELWNKLFQLVTEVEEWVWRVSMLSTQNSAELEEDSFNDFLRNERAPDLIAKLSNVFPNFTGLQISDAEKVHKCVEDAMRQLYVLRHSLVWKSVDSDE